jgi:hypothetical protein
MFRFIFFEQRMWLNTPFKEVLKQVLKNIRYTFK